MNRYRRNVICCVAGIGTAKMRVAITEGFRGSIESMKESCGLEPHDVVHMMMVTHYLDVLKDFAQVCVCVCLLHFLCVFLYVFSPSSHLM